MKGNRIRSSEITPEHVYFSRRRLLKAGAYALGTMAGASLLSACGGQLGETLGNRPNSGQAANPSTAATALPGQTPVATANVKRDEMGDPVNSWDDITNYNNFYEFTEDKQGVAALAKDFQPNTWTISVGGMVDKPMTDIEEFDRVFEGAKAARLAYWDAIGEPRHSEPGPISLKGWVAALRAAAEV